MMNVSRQYTSSTERVADQARVTPGEIAMDSDTGNTYRRTTGGWIIAISAETAASVDVNTAIVADVDAAVAASTSLRLVGYACRESAAAAATATFIIVHGATGAGGTPIAPIELAANESAREWFGPEGIACPNGLSIDWISGTVDVDLYYKT